MMVMIGINVKEPSRQCQNPLCPFHGHLKVRGRVFEGVVVSDKMEKSVVVKRDYVRLVPKFERYEKRSSKITAHNPECIGAKSGDKVKIMECRPLSKTKTFVVVEVT